MSSESKDNGNGEEDEDVYKHNPPPTSLQKTSICGKIV